MAAEEKLDEDRKFEIMASKLSHDSPVGCVYLVKVMMQE